GKIFVESTLIDRKVQREDVEAFYIPATKMASEIGAPTLANMVMLGKVIKETGAVNFDDIEEGLRKVIPARKADMLKINLKAIEAGYNF
ncbi:MAG: 2-oxoacid:acceptor oxidoreductase family protein, partial [Clostridia bacterium]|nr:2-oxoacid:acceptor oxidoreductase family protein [Clostridia bacterium]